MEQIKQQRNEEFGPVMKILLAALCLVMVAILASSCGTRKSAVEITKTKDVQDTKKSETTVSKDSTKSSSKEAETNVKTNTSEAAVTTTTTEFDKDGNIRKQTTKVENKKRSGTENSTKNKEAQYMNVKNVTRHLDEVTHITKTTFNKKKDTENNSTWVANVGGPWVILGAITILGLIFAGYKYLTRKPKVAAPDYIKKAL